MIKIPFDPHEPKKPLNTTKRKETKKFERGEKREGLSI